MAEIFKKELRDTIVYEPLDPAAVAYCSPESLKYRVIIKHKKLKTRSEDEDVGMERDVGSSRDDEEGARKPSAIHLDDSVKIGTLMLEVGDGNWSEYVFVLNEKLLTWMADEDKGGQDHQPDDDPENQEDAETELNKEDELHFGEDWFHGLMQGRNEAEALLSMYMRDHPDDQHGHDGLFLVRDSSTFKDEFSLSLFRRYICPWLPHPFVTMPPPCPAGIYWVICFHLLARSGCTSNTF